MCRRMPSYNGCPGRVQGARKRQARKKRPKRAPPHHLDRFGFLNRLNSLGDQPPFAMRGNHDADPWSQPCPCPDLTPSCLEMHDPLCVRFHGGRRSASFLAWRLRISQRAASSQCGRGSRRGRRGVRIDHHFKRMLTIPCMDGR